MRKRKIPRVVWAAAWWVLFLAGPVGRSQEQTAAALPRTNAEVMHTLVEGMLEHLLPMFSLRQGDSVGVSILPGQDSWLIERGIAASLQRAGISAFRLSDTVRRYTLLLDIRAPQLNVVYGGGHREGLFGEKKITRTVIAGFSLQATEPGSGKIIYSDMLRQQYADTIAAGNVSSMELPSMPSTHGELPGDNVLDRVIEPFVIIGATAVAVYLFFHIRS